MGKKNLKVKDKISVSSDDEETLKYPYVQIQFQIGNCNRTANSLIKGINHTDTEQAMSKMSTKS